MLKKLFTKGIDHIRLQMRKIIFFVSDLAFKSVILELPRLFRRPISAENHDLVIVQPKKIRLANYAPNDLKFFLEAL